MIPKPTKKQQSRKKARLISKAQELSALSPLCSSFFLPSEQLDISNVSAPAHAPRYYLLFHHWTVIFRLVPIFQESPKCTATGSVFQLFTMCWVLSKDTFYLFHPQVTFCLCLGSWNDLSMCKIQVHFAPLYPTFKLIFLVLSPSYTANVLATPCI